MLLGRIRWVGAVIFLVSSLVLADVTPTNEDENPLQGLDEEIPYTASSLTMALDIQYVPAHYPNHLFSGSTTSDSYGNGVHIGLSWLPIRKYGKMGVGLGLGFAAIRNVDVGGTNATLTTIPGEAFVDYHFDYWNKQILVPFVKLGTELVYARQSGVDIPGKTYWGLLYGGGFQFCLDALDAKAARTMDSNFGINNTYLIFEYLKSSQIKKDEAPYLERGEFRVGLRFEI